MREFFEVVRKDFGPLSQSQVDGFNVLIDASYNLPLRHQAYVLATAWHETARTMQPIIERGSRSYFDMYEPPSKKAKSLGNTLKGDGYKFRGRGYVQITGRANYAKASKIVNDDLVASPEKALESDIAAAIITDGMSKGWFTGKKMADYPDYTNMRRVVNGLDKTDVITGYAIRFEKALLETDKAVLAQQDRIVAKASQEPVQPVSPSPAPIPSKPPETQSVAIYRPWWKRLFGIA